MIKRLVLNQKEIYQIEKLLYEISKKTICIDNSNFLHELVILSHRLPLRIRKFLNNFRLKEADDMVACVVSGYPINHEKIGLTPLNRNSKNIINTLEEEIFFVLLGSLLGDNIAWSAQQAGHIIHDILPVSGQENEQTGSSSKEELFFHTEDSFHNYRGDYLGMMCLRNNDNQAFTTIASREILKLIPSHIKNILFESRFIIQPDASYFEKHEFIQKQDLNKLDFENFLIDSEIRIKDMKNNPKPISILFGSKKNPYIRVDCINYMDALDEEANRAFKIFTDAFNKALIEMELKDGEVCFIDNFRAVHGRTPFKFPPKYDGSDRWMKRINITRDLRKSQDLRVNTTSRVIF